MQIRDTVKNYDDFSDDVFQEVCLTFVKYLISNTPSVVHDPVSYVRQMYRNKIRDEISEKQRNPTSAAVAFREDTVAVREDTVAVPFPSSEVIWLVRKCVARLKPREREVAELTLYEEKSHEEIARVMGITKSASESLRHRAFRKLRQCLIENDIFGV
jgi:RNA polymerase sigma factor (sigma-70 family)